MPSCDFSLWRQASRYRDARGSYKLRRINQGIPGFENRSNVSIHFPSDP
jgi:hypothetical protein